MSEALALIDLLVLVRARFFVGFWFSSLSWVVQVGRPATAGLIKSSCCLHPLC
jgi:hypothetical protein